MDFGLAPFLLLAIVAGYRFVKHWEATRYRLAREQGHRLYFEATFYGMLLSVLTVCLLALIYHLLPVSIVNTTLFDYSINERITLQELLLAALIAAPFLAQWAALAANKLIVNKTHFYEALAQNDFELLLVDAVASDNMVMVTMDDDKVYVGWVYTTSDPANGERRYFSLIPVISGYRNTPQHKVEFTTYYAEIFDKTDERFAELDMDDFVVVLPIDKVTSARRFDPEVYAQFQELGKAEAE
ncbi:MAG: DUF6338 family protein [Pseudomonadota bacterium]